MSVLKFPPWVQPTPLIALACTWLLVAWAYWPGLDGPFLFDDFANLDDIGAYGPVRDWESFLYYVTSGTADPTGRPIALLTFLVDATDWPADPWPFKRTNLIIHLLNTALLAWVVARLQVGLQRRLPSLQLSRWTPLVAAALWAAHPFFVSTTLYAVQREAMLPLTFVLMALLAWDQAVLSFTHERRISGWMWGAAGLGGFTLLAGLSKANGFLAPLLAGLAYLWCLRPDSGKQRRSMDQAAILCLGVPTVIVLGYLVQYGIDRWTMPYLHGRDWTTPERLLSQPRALWKYVWHLILPRAGGGGLFVEGFAVSRSWFSPVTTLPAAVVLLGSVIAAVVSRRRFPIASFAWVFFLTAHLMESSVISLELYFEHRNYLPAAFLGWPLAHLMLRPGRYLRYRVGFISILAAALLLLTHQRAVVWGNADLLTALTAAHQQDSIRSQVADAQQQVKMGNVASGLARIHALQQSVPESVTVAINSVALECAGTGELSRQTLSLSRETLASAKDWNYGLYTWFRDAAYAPSTRNCHGFGLDGLNSLISAFANNPGNVGHRRRRDLFHVRGQVALAAGQMPEALKWFDEALIQIPDPNYALVQAAALGNAGFQKAGVIHLDHYLRLESQRRPRVRDMRTLHRWLLAETGYYRREIDTLRNRMIADQPPKGRASVDSP